MIFIPKPKNPRLTPKELKFINNYLESGNIVQSVMSAGYTDKYGTAAVMGNRLLKNSKVGNEIRRRQAKMEKKSIMTATEVMEYFTAVARGEIKDQFGLDAPLSERTRAAQEIAKRTIDLENRLQGKADAEVVIKLDWGREEDK